MNNQRGDKVIGGIMLIGLFLIITCIVGAINAFHVEEYIGAGLLMIAAGLPISFALLGIFLKK